MAKETWLKALILSFSCLLLPGISVVCRKGHAEDERRFHPLSFSKAAVCRIGRHAGAGMEEDRKDGRSALYLHDAIAGTGAGEGDVVGAFTRKQDGIAENVKKIVYFFALLFSPPSLDKTRKSSPVLFYDLR